MKLECKIKRRGGTVVDMPNGKGQPDTRVHFKPLDPDRPDSPHVAEVSTALAQRFLRADANVYLLFEGAKVPDLNPPGGDDDETNGDGTDDGDGDDQGEGEGTGDGDQTGEDGEGDEKPDGDPPKRITLKDLRAGIASGDLKPEALRGLLESEQQAAAPRKAIVDTILKVLK